jgi:hypothetical protein
MSSEHQVSSNVDSSNSYSNFNKPGADEDEDDDDDDDEEEGEDDDDEEEGVAKKRIGKEDVPSVDLLNKLEVSGDVYWHKEYRRYFASPRDMVYISAKEKDKEGISTKVKRIEVKVDNGEYKEHSGNKTGRLSLLEEGSHNVTARAIDYAGNRSNNKVEEIIIDNTPPSIHVWYEIPDIAKQYCILNGDVYVPLVPNNIVHIPRCHIVKAKAFDWGAGVLKGGLYYSIDSEIEYKPLTENGIKLYEELSEERILGYHQLRIKSVDNVYNESKPLVINIYLDDVTPSFMLVPKYGKSILFIGKVLREECGPHPLPKPDPVPLPPPPRGPSGVPDGPDKPPRPPTGIDQEDWSGQTGFEYWKKFFNYSATDNPFDYLPGASLTELGFYKSDGQFSADDFYGDMEEDDKGTKVDADKLGYDPSVDNEWTIFAFDESGISEISIRKDATKWDMYRPGQTINFYTQAKHKLDIRVYDCVGNVLYGRQDIYVKILPPESSLSHTPSENEAVPTGPANGSGDDPQASDDDEADEYTGSEKE